MENGNIKIVFDLCTPCSIQHTPPDTHTHSNMWIVKCDAWWWPGPSISHMSSTKKEQCSFAKFISIYLHGLPLSKLMVYLTWTQQNCGKIYYSLASQIACGMVLGIYECVCASLLQHNRWWSLERTQTHSEYICKNAYQRLVRATPHCTVHTGKPAPIHCILQILYKYALCTMHIYCHIIFGIRVIRDTLPLIKIGICVCPSRAESKF